MVGDIKRGRCSVEKSFCRIIRRFDTHHIVLAQSSWVQMTYFYLCQATFSSLKAALIMQKEGKRHKKCPVKIAGTNHTSYLSRTPRTLSVEQKCSCGAILLHMKFFNGHVEQNCFPWQSILLHMTKLLVMWSNFGMWINDKLLLMPNFDPRDKFTMYAVLSWFTLFWCKIHFVAIYALLCGAKNNQQILSVEHKWQIWCMLGLSETLFLDLNKC